MKNNLNLLASNNKRSIKNILIIGLFAVVMISSLFSNGLIISQAMASGNTTSVIDNTSLSVVTNQNTVQSGSQVTLTATVQDTSSSPTTPTGSVSWSDAGGSFSPDSCIVTSNHCALAYTPPSNPSGSITISASYPGDTTHLGSSATSVLTVNVTPSSPTQPSTTSQSNPSPTKSSTQSTTQSTQNPTQPSQTSVNNNQQLQQNPIAAISKVISNVVSVLESLFSKI